MNIIKSIISFLIFYGLISIVLSGCTLDQTELKTSEGYCSDKGGVYEITFDMHIPVVHCRDGNSAHIYNKIPKP